MKKTLKHIRRTSHNAYVVVIAIAVVMFWYGMLGLLDQLLFPNNPILSYLVALLVGLTVLFVNDFQLDELE